MNHLRTLGFSLIELMVVVVIIGILSAIAMPAYNAYTLNAKIAESYSILDLITKNEIAFFNEHREFFTVSRNPSEVTAAPMIIYQNPDYEKFGYPAPVGTRTYFSYLANAGKTDASGTEITGILTIPGSTLMSMADEDSNFAPISDGTYCNGGQGYHAQAMGVQPANSLDWSLVSATGIFDGKYEDSSSCTTIFRVIQSSDATGNEPSANGFVILNRGS